MLLASLCPAFGQLTRVTPSGLKLPASVPAAPYNLVNAFGSTTFSQPVAVVSAPGLDSTVFVVELSGRIQAVNVATSAKTIFFDIAQVPAAPAGSPSVRFYKEGESGLLGLAFHPDYATNRTFFIFYSVQIDGRLHQRLARVRASSQSLLVADPASLEPLISQFDESANHNGGDLHFGADNQLYVSLGDEGGADDSLDNARWVDRDFHAAILRLDVDRKNVGLPGGSREPNPHPAIDRDAQGRARYAIPPDNPLLTGVAGTSGPTGAGAYPFGGPLDAAKLRTEFYAYGLRNPWRFSFDPPTGRLFVADVGQEKREEINLVAKGANLGWPYREGFIDGPKAADSPVSPASPRVEPIHDYPRADGYSVTGGRVYRGTAFPELHGAYLFADYIGLIYALRESSGAWSRELVYRGPVAIAGIGRHPAGGDLLFADLGTGQIRKLVRQERTATLPPTLSATGLFSDVATLTPAPGVVPYEVNHPAWNDHARSRRWFAFSDPGSLLYAHNIGDAWTPPTNAVWIQHLELETTRGDPATARRIETRVLVKTTRDAYAVAYRWREDQSDADLLPPEGADRDIAVSVDGVRHDQRWRTPSWAECLACHSPAANPARGFDQWQLNRTVTHGAVAENQIRRLRAAGYLSTWYAPAEADYAALPAHAVPGDADESVEHRLRSYLAVNCAPCHSGSAAPSGGAGFSVSPALSTFATRLRHAVPDNTGGDPDSRLLAPDEPEHSMLLRRILGDGVARMPPIGPREIDPAAESLLRAYIAGLAEDRFYDDWHHVHFVGGNPAREAETDPDGDGFDNRMEYLARSSPVAPGPDPLNLRVEHTPQGSRVRFLQPVGRFAAVEYMEGGAWKIVAPSGPGFGYPVAATEREVLVPPTRYGQPFQTRVRLEER